jgi:hypothetical protein
VKCNATPANKQKFRLLIQNIFEPFVQKIVILQPQIARFSEAKITPHHAEMKTMR